MKDIKAGNSRAATIVGKKAMEAKTTIIIIFYSISCTPYYMHGYHQTSCEVRIEGGAKGDCPDCEEGGGEDGEIWLCHICKLCCVRKTVTPKQYFEYSQ